MPRALISTLLSGVWESVLAGRASIPDVALGHIRVSWHPRSLLPKELFYIENISQYTYLLLMIIGYNEIKTTEKVNIMLIQFRVGNYLSFKDIVTLNMTATALKENADTHTFKEKDLRLLKSCVIYGANASGKTNLFLAMLFMSNFVRHSSKDMQAGEKIDIDKFTLSTQTENEPSFFEIAFIKDSIKYRYGFKIDYDRVIEEWLHIVQRSKERELFTRKLSQFSISKEFREGRGIEDKTRSNALFLSVVAQFNGEISTKIMDWFNNFNIISGADDDYTGYSAKYYQENRADFLELINNIDLDIADIKINDEEVDIKNLPEPARVYYKHKNPQLMKVNMYDVMVYRKKYDNNNQFVSNERFNMYNQESDGTKKLFGLLGPILDTLKNGTVLVIDEIDARLHTLIVRFILQMFNSNDKNPLNAQLLVNVHDTNLLKIKYLRRDQIWFTEKDKFGKTDLYSLVEYNVRNDASLEKDYLLGKYGSIPFIDDLQFVYNKDNG